LLTDIGAAINRYFAWMTTGPRWRLAAGIGGPILVLFLFYQLVSGGSDPVELAINTPVASASQAVTVEQASATAPAANGSAAQTTTPGTAASTTGTPRANTTPQATVAPGGTYVVKSGDTLGAICSANVPSMSINACVDAIVQLNSLANAADLQIDQRLTLPGGTPGAGTTPARTTTPAAATTPAATATRVP
jgi:LysM repeat protein